MNSDMLYTMAKYANIDMKCITPRILELIYVKSDDESINIFAVNITEPGILLNNDTINNYVNTIVVIYFLTC